MQLKFLIFSAAFIAAASFAAAQTNLPEKTEREFQECSVCPMMVGIPAGSFSMGSPQTESGRFDTEGPAHRVSVRAFALSKFAISSAEFLTFLRDTGYQPPPCNTILNTTWHSPGRGLAYAPYDSEPPHWPAVCLNWMDAKAYVAWLNKKVRAERPELAGKPDPYRLPNEAEWEYAARAGTTTARWWGEDIGKGNANCNGCGSPWDYRYLADVDAFPANPFGLRGMLGNAWQWTEDCWHESYVGAPTDGSAWTEPNCPKHVIRGGSYDNFPTFVRSASRSGGTARGEEYDYSSLAGFRIARTLP
jgi:formylglycine-generating enzyme required for sulfatase activity